MTENTKVETETIPESETTVIDTGESEASISAEIDAAQEAASEFFPAEGQEESSEPQPTTEPAPASEPPSPTPTPTPKIDPLWAEAARRVGLTDSEIANLKDDREAEQHVAVRRVQHLRDAGIDPMELAAFQQWRQAAGAQAPQPSPAGEQTPASHAGAVLEDLKLEFDEDELAPEIVSQLRAVEKYTNQLKVTLGTENKQLREEMAGLHQSVAQRAEQANQTQNEVRWAAEWDDAARATPGFVEAMGLPSEVRRLPMDDPRVQKYVAFRAYFEPAWHHHVKTLGSNNVALKRVISDAFSASPFTGEAKTNGTARPAPAPAPGSVVRSASKRASADPKGEGIDAELRRAMDVMEGAWGNTGENPFNTQ